MLLHYLILGNGPSWLGSFHLVAVAVRGVLDETESQWPASVLIPREFGCCRLAFFSAELTMTSHTNRSLRVFSRRELNHSRPTGATVRLVLDLCPVYLPDGREEFHQIFIARGPRQLETDQHFSPPRLI
jgi:hypothetical protein